MARNEPPLVAILSRLALCNIVLVEGDKRGSQEDRDAAREGGVPLAHVSYSNIVVVASDFVAGGETLPASTECIKAIADFIEAATACREKKGGRGVSVPYN